MRKRTFLRWIFCAFAASGFAAFVVRGAATEPVVVKIIAFNDFHGNLQSPGTFRATAESPAVAVGGADELAAYVKYLAAQNPNHVVVAAGDLVGGESAGVGAVS